VTGGEEFLIAEATHPGEAETIAERLRQEVTAIPRGATASVGVASIRRVDIDDTDARAVIEHLVDTADTAMYEAKRAGGNRTRHAAPISQHIDRLTS
jgi:GGDEF domain-containing protein